MAATLRQRLPVENVLVDHGKLGRGSQPATAGSVTGSDADSSEDDDMYYTDLPPFTPPTFTVKDLLGAIPPECFERSALKSMQYVVQDFTMIATLMYAASHIEPAFGSNGQVLNGWTGFAAKWALWSVYWILAGFNYTGVWIIGEFLHTGHVTHTPFLSGCRAADSLRARSFEACRRRRARCYLSAAKSISNIPCQPENPVADCVLPLILYRSPRM